MLHPNSGHLMRIRSKVIPVLLGPPVLAFLPAITLATFWLGGEVALLAVALGLPVLFAAMGAFGSPRMSYVPRDSITGMLLREGFEMELERAHRDTDDTGLKSAVLILEIDDYKELISRHGQSDTRPSRFRCQLSDLGFSISYGRHYSSIGCQSPCPSTIARCYL